MDFSELDDSNGSDVGEERYVEGLEKVARRIVETGCTSFVGTVITQEEGLYKRVSGGLVKRAIFGVLQDERLVELVGELSAVDGKRVLTDPHGLPSTEWGREGAREFGPQQCSPDVLEPFHSPRILTQECILSIADSAASPAPLPTFTTQISPCPGVSRRRTLFTSST